MLKGTLVRRVFVLIVMLLGGFGLHAQIIQVKDANTKSAIAYVFIYNDNGSVNTDDKGLADVSELINGAEALNFQHMGYRQVSIDVNSLKKADHVVLLEQSVVSVEEIVLSVNKWEQNQREISTTVKLVDKAEVTFKNPQTTADLLGLSNNVYIQKSQLGGGSPMIRGFATSRLLMVVDGVRMNNAIFREGNIQNVISLDPNAIQSTEVLFGPGSAIYGSDALGGVMSFKTIEPTFKVVKGGLSSLNAFLRYGSANFETSGHMDFNFAGERWASRTSVSFSDFGDLTMGSNGPEEYLRREYQNTTRGVDTVLKNDKSKKQIESGYSQLNLMQKIAFKSSDYGRWDLGLHYSTSSDVPRYDRLIRYKNNELEYADWYYGPQIWSMANLSYQNLRVSSPLFNKVKFVAAYQYFKESRNSRKFDSPTHKTQTETVNAYSANVDFEKRFNDRLNMFYGVEGVYNLVGSSGFDRNIFTGEKATIGSRYPDGSEWFSAAAYLTMKYKLNSHFILDGGLRESFVQSKATFDPDLYQLPFSNSVISNSALNGMLGLTYLPNDYTRLYTNVSSGFRAPNIDDVAKVFDPEPNTVVVPNPTLNPEYLWNFELGWVQKITANYSFEIVGFYNYLTDAMVRRPYTYNGQDSLMYDGSMSQVVAIQNTDNAVIYGLQIGVNGNINRHLAAKANINFTEGEASDGSALRHVSPLFGQIGLIFTHGWFKADISWVYNGEIPFEKLAPSERNKAYLYLADDNGNPYSPSWSTLNLRMSFKLSHYLEALGGIENITDVRYRPYSSGIVAPGRNVYLSMRAYL